MDGPVFEQFYDEHGNIHVRVSDEVVMLTPDESKRALEVFHQLNEENEKLRRLVGHLMYIKPRDVTSILVNGEVLRFDDLLAEVGMRWEDL